MRVSEVLWRLKRDLPGGHLWRGKHRLYKKVTPIILGQKKLEFEIEERNMFYLRHPYLTIEQSRGHALPFKHHEKFIERMKKKKLAWRDHGRLGDRLGFLTLTDMWE